MSLGCLYIYTILISSFWNYLILDDEEEEKRREEKTIFKESRFQLLFIFIFANPPKQKQKGLIPHQIIPPTPLELILYSKL